MIIHLRVILVFEVSYLFLTCNFVIVIYDFLNLDFGASLHKWAEAVHKGVI